MPVIDGIAADGRPPAPAAVRQDGAFTVAGILPGRYLLTASVPDRPDGARWWLKSAITAGRDLLDDPIDVTAGTPSLRDVVLTFSNRQSELMGTLQTAAGLPASEFFVIVYPVEQRWWRPGARRVRVTRPASDGAYAVPALPPGDYFIAALTDVAPDEWNDPQFLARLQGASVRVSVKDGERTVQDLRIK